MKRALLLLAVVAGCAPLTTVHQSRRATLDIYFIDVEGGQATLMVTPAGASFLVDAGFPGDGTFASKPGDPAKARDAQRVVAAARDAGISRIDYLMITHYHADHVGAVEELSRLMPIGTFIDHEAPLPEAEAGVPGTQAVYDGYLKVRAAGKHLQPKPGDRLPVDGIDAVVVSSAGQTLSAALHNGPSANAACAGPGLPAQEKTENPRSTGVRVQFGAFSFLDIGDLSGAPLAALICPRNMIGRADVYLVAHHAGLDAADPAIFATIQPRAAIFNNGPRKGGAAETFLTLRQFPSIELWQLHRALGAGVVNMPDDRVANLDESTSAWIKLSAKSDGSFTITNGRTGAVKNYPAAASSARPAITNEVRPYVSVDAPIVALTHARLVDGTGAPARDDQTVIINGSRIASVGPSATTAVPSGARTLDLSGQTVLPGLVGLHEHTYFGGVKRVTEMSTSGPLLYLAFGVTTAMTAGSQLPYDELNLKRSVDAGKLPGPRFLISGPYLDGGGARNGKMRALDHADEAARVVNYWADEGASWVKIMGNVSREMFGHIVRAAHARGLKVTGHLCSVTFAEAAELGIDALQHGFITASEYVPGKKPDECPAGNMRAQTTVDVGSDSVQRSIRALAARGTPVVSTLGVYETFSKERFRPDTAALAMLDPDVRREVEANYAALGQPGAFAVTPALLKKMMRWERDFVAAGGLLGAGSDPWGTGYLPGFGDVRNHEMLVEAGFSPEESIRIMTLNGAKILGMDREIGAVTAGRQADLVVVRGDPVRRPRDIYQTTTIFRSGVGYDADKLRAAARGLVGVR